MLKKDLFSYKKKEGGRRRKRGCHSPRENGRREKRKKSSSISKRGECSDFSLPSREEEEVCRFFF